jgi:hypothetical protein
MLRLDHLRANRAGWEASMARAERRHEVLHVCSQGRLR